MSKVIKYINATDRNNPDTVRSHIYAQTKAAHLWPMCDYGWNRSDGQRYSLLRGWTSARGRCVLCEKNVDADKRPVFKAREHKTKWL